MIAESASAAAKGDLSKLSVLPSPSDILHRVDKMNLLAVAEAQTKQIWSDWWKYFDCDIHAVLHNFPVLRCGFGEQLGLHAKVCGAAVTSHVGLPIFLQKPGGWFYSHNAVITPLVFLTRKVNQLASESSDILKLPGSWWLARWMSKHGRVKNLKYLAARLIKTNRKLQSHQAVFLMSLRTLKKLRVQFFFC